MLVLLTTVVITAELTQVPVVHVHRSVGENYQFRRQSREMFQAMRQLQPTGLRKLFTGSTDWGEVEYDSVKVTRTFDAKKHTFTKIWGNAEGALIYYDVGGPSRYLPDIIPIPGKLGITFPHRVVWYRVLDEGESLEEWLAAYAGQYTRWHVAGEGTRCEVQHAAKARRARLTVRIGDPIRLPPGLTGDDEFPRMADGYYIGRSRLGDEVVNGYAREVNGVIFRAACSELFTMDLAKTSDFIRNQDADYVISVRPQGIPANVLKEFVGSVERMVAPRLQRADSESEYTHLQRTALGRWQLDLVQFGLQAMESATFSIRGLAGSAESLEFNFDMRAKKASVQKVFGQTRRTKGSRLAEFRKKKAWASLAYHGRLSDQLRSSLTQAAELCENRLLRDGLVQTLAVPDQEIVLKLGGSTSKKHENEFGLYGAVATQYATQVFDGLAESGERSEDAIVFHSPESQEDAPRNIGLTVNSGAICVAMSDHELSGYLEQITDQPRAKASSTIFEFRADLAELLNRPAKQGFAGLPARVGESIERGLSRLALASTLGPSMTPQLKREIEFLESAPGTVDVSDVYQKQLQMYFNLKAAAFDPGRDSFRHWLRPASANVEFKVSIDPEGLKVKGEIGRDIIRFTLGQWHRTQLAAFSIFR